MGTFNNKKVFTSVGLISFVVFGILSLYIYILPAIITSDCVINIVEKFVQKEFGAKLNIDDFSIETNLSPTIKIRLDEINLTKNEDKLFYLDNLNLVFSWKNILARRIIIKHLGFDDIYVDVNKLLALFPQQEAQKQPAKPLFGVDLYDARLYVKNCNILYNLDSNTAFKLSAKNVETNNAEKVNRRIYFDILFEIIRYDKNLQIALNDSEKVFISNKNLFVNDLPISINGSNVYLKVHANRKIKIHLDLYANNFNLDNVVQLINTNLLYPDSDKILASIIKDIKGSFDFNIGLTPKKIEGKINLHSAEGNVVPFNDMPLKLTEGNITIDNKKIVLNDFKGYFNGYKQNSLDFAGDIKDYFRSFDTNIIANAKVTNGFMKYRMSKIIGYPLGMQGEADTRVILKSKDCKVDLLWLFRLLPGNDILVDGMNISSVNRERCFATDLHFDNMLLKIRSIDYFLTLMKNGQEVRKSIMNVKGNIDCNGTGKLLDLGLYVSDPLPSEFFNVFLKRPFFKEGYINGKINIVNTGEYPVLDANMVAKNIRIPTQRLRLHEAKIVTNKKDINVTANGRFKRSKYSVTSTVENKLAFPLFLKHANLSIDSMDFGKILESMNATITPENMTEVNEANKKNDEAGDDNASFVYETGLLVIDDCNFHLGEGKYKDINLGNLDAKLTLNKEGVLEIKSNKFNFAEGISTLKVVCDLIKHNYYIRLGAKDVETDPIASSLLGLQKEIRGKAKGLIELNTDDSLKMNGVIKFDMNDGAITSVGFLEYVLKFASIFRNPLAMVNPATIMDLMNIPDGSFDRIYGELIIKDNVILPMKIKSKAAQLSAYIIGTYDLEKKDAILRIYTKMSNKHKGIYGVMRHISLNAIANKLPLGNTNETNYYSNEIKELPALDLPDEECQIFLTKVDGDLETGNFISSLKRIK